MNQELINESVRRYLEADKVFKDILGEYFPTTWGEVNMPKKVLNHEGLERIKKAEEEAIEAKKVWLRLIGWPEDYLNQVK